MDPGARVRAPRALQHVRPGRPAAYRTPVLCRAQRVGKNPKKFKNMDELRDHLEQPQGMGGGISAALNWISANSFGSTASVSGLGWLYRWLLQLTPNPRARRNGPHRWDVPAELLARAEASPLTGILLVSPMTLAGMAIEVPQVLAMTELEAVVRLTSLKALLPDCDLCHLVVTEPRLYLGSPQPEVEGRIRRSVGLLTAQRVPTSVVQGMIMHDPGLPFVTTEAGVLEMRDLWPIDLVDEQALIDSDPKHLALAVRAFSTRLR